MARPNVLPPEGPQGRILKSEDSTTFALVRSRSLLRHTRSFLSKTSGNFAGRRGGQLLFSEGCHFFKLEARPRPQGLGAFDEQDRASRTVPSMAWQSKLLKVVPAAE
jgi:hypothetical protein